MTKTAIKQQIIGEGVLTWQRAERMSDRYGSVYLMKDKSEAQVRLNTPRSGEGTLISEVIETRISRHIGDCFRGVCPRQTIAGTRVTLGTGRLFQQIEDGIVSVGVKPNDDRCDNWMDIRALYDVHEHVVRLIWEPKES